MEDNRSNRNFREYEVWIDAVKFATEVYQTTSTLPWFEKKGLCDQLQRAAVSISSNIAEGAAKPSDQDFAKYLDIALGSAYEVETQLIISKNINYITQESFDQLIIPLHSIERQLTAFIHHIRKKRD
ncbi:four helix bundle protein [Sodaliphilus sp.]|uniref:four helix bundle protein n=1 Tax=Sodaliphilus sp. TaxID=2815818 RepID=UPI00389057AF